MWLGFPQASLIFDRQKLLLLNPTLYIRPRPNIISRPKVFLVKESTRIKIILIASYFFSEIELATIDRRFSTLCDHFCLWNVKCLLGNTFRTILKEETISIDLVSTQKPEEPSIFPSNTLISPLISVTRISTLVNRSSTLWIFPSILVRTVSQE